MQKFRKYWWVILIFVIGAGLLWWWRGQQNRKVEYQTVRPERRELVSELEVSGAVDARERVDLRFAAPSRLSWVGVKEGDWVKPWQAIASVDTRTLQKQLMIDLNSYSKERIDFDQTGDDYDDKTLTDEIKRILETSQYDLNNSVLNVEIRDLAIKLSTISSPIAGVVTRVDTPFAGVNVGVADTFQIVNPETIFFSAVVDEEDVAKVRQSLPATIILDAFADEEIKSQVEWVEFSSSTSENGGTGYAIRLQLPVRNDQLQYRLDMNGTALIQLEKKPNALSLPIETLISREDNTFVQVVDSAGVASEREISVGLESDDYIEVIEGVTENDLVVLPSSGE